MPTTPDSPYGGAGSTQVHMPTLHPLLAANMWTLGDFRCLCNSRPAMHVAAALPTSAINNQYGAALVVSAHKSHPRAPWRLASCTAHPSKHCPGLTVGDTC